MMKDLKPLVSFLLLCCGAPSTTSGFTKSPPVVRTIWKVSSPQQQQQQPALLLSSSSRKIKFSRKSTFVSPASSSTSALSSSESTISSAEENLVEDWSGEEEGSFSDNNGGGNTVYQTLERIPTLESAFPDNDASFRTSPEPTTAGDEVAPVTKTKDSSVTTSSNPVSVAGTTFNVMKAMLGSGVLALPSGLAVVTDYKSAVWSTNILFVVLGLFSAYTFGLYGRLCHSTNAQSLGDVWKRVYNSTDSLPMSITNFSFCYGGCLIFLLIIGDAMSSLARAVLSSASSPNPLLATAWLGSRQTAILSIMGTVLVPLCNLKSLAALSPISIVGVMASIISSAFVVWRCPLLVPSSPYCTAAAAASAAASSGASTTAAVASGNFLASLPSNFVPQFGSYSNLFSSAPLVLLGMACMALMAHFSAPDFYQALAGGGGASKSPSPNADTTLGIQTTTDANNEKNDLPLKKYMKTTILSFIAVGVVNAVTMTCGFLTFGGNCAGMILNNYAINDIGAAVSRMLVAVSMIGGFPLLFMALRSSAEELLWTMKEQKQQRRSRNKKASTEMDANNQQSLFSTSPTATPTKSNAAWKLKLGLLSSLTFLSMVVNDVGLVVSLIGNVTGSAIIYAFPAMMFLRLTRRGGGKNGNGVRVRNGERAFCRGLVGFGVASAVLGGATTLFNACFP